MYLQRENPNVLHQLNRAPSLVSGYIDTPQATFELYFTADFVCNNRFPERSDRVVNG